jgi:hypothetical protein
MSVELLKQLHYIYFFWGLIMSIPDFQKQFQSLITDLTKPITTTSPKGTKSSPLAKTSFELNPFAEMKFIDPYAPKDMASLTEAELGIDNVISYLESIIPSDLLSTLMNLPDLANELLNRADTLESFVLKIKDQFTFNLSFQDALRNLGIMKIYANLEGFKDRYLALGNRFEDMGDRFFQKGMSTMDRARSRYGYSSYGSYSSGLWNGDVNKTLTSRYAITGIAVAQTEQMANNHKSYSTIFRESGNINNSTLTRVSLNTPNKDLPIIIGGIKVVGGVRSAGIIDDISTSSTDKVIKKITDISTTLASTKVQPETPIDEEQIENIRSVDNLTLDKTLDLKDIITGSTIPNEQLTNTSDLITAIGVDGTRYIKTQLTSSGVVFVRDTHVVIIRRTVSKFNVSTMQDILTYIDDNSLLDWIATHDRTPVDEFITLLEDEDYELTKYIVNSLVIIDIGEMETRLTTLDSTSDASITAINTLSLNSPETFNKDVARIIAMPDTDFKTISKLATNYGTSSLLMYSDLVNTLLVENLTPLITSLGNTSLEDVATLTPILSTISDEDASNIMSSLVANDPNKILTSYSDLVNPFLNFAIHETCLNYANLGEYTTVKDLITTYPNSMSYNEKKDLVKLLLKNYKITDNDILLGYTQSASLFLDTLLQLDPNLLITDRNGSSIKTISPWLNASKDALYLLKHNPLCSVGITIRQNKQFKG